MSDAKTETVLAMYRPRPGRDADLRAVIAEHVSRLRSWGFAGDRPVVLLQATDGTYVEIFDWLEGAAQRAHSDARVEALWDRFAEVCEFVAPAQLPDATRPFPHFRRVEGVTV